MQWALLVLMWLSLLHMVMGFASTACVNYSFCIGNGKLSLTNPTQQPPIKAKLRSVKVNVCHTAAGEMCPFSFIPLTAPYCADSLFWETILDVQGTYTRTRTNTRTNTTTHTYTDAASIVSGIKCWVSFLTNLARRKAKDQQRCSRQLAGEIMFLTLRLKSNSNQSKKTLSIIKADINETTHLSQASQM